MANDLAGRIEITLDKYAYKLGETISCGCALRLRAPLNARRLKAIFRRMDEHIDGKEGKNKTVELAHKDIGPARVYKDGETFPFSFVVDKNAAPEQEQYGGVLGRIIDPSDLSTRMTWSIEVSLDMPLVPDVSGTSEVRIIRPPAPEKK